MRDADKFSHCQDCPSCPAGREPNLHCGDEISAYEAKNIFCRECVASTYSPHIDPFPCYPCSERCGKDHVVLQNCSATSDIKCGTRSVGPHAQCSSTQFSVRHADRFSHCQDCPSCPVGKEPNLLCGTVVSASEANTVFCRECAPGTLSLNIGPFPCYPCHGACHGSQVCRRGFYYDFRSGRCEECSWCCGDRYDILEHECIQEGMPVERSCTAYRLCDRVTPDSTYMPTHYQNYTDTKRGIMPTNSAIHPPPTGNRGSSSTGLIMVLAFSICGALLCGVLLWVWIWRRYRSKIVGRVHGKYVYDTADNINSSNTTLQ